MALMQCNKRSVLLILLGSVIQAVGVSSIHAYSDITEGGVIGLTLLLSHWTGWSAAFYSVVLNAACYLLGWRTLGKSFLLYSILSSGVYALVYAVCEPFAPLFPWILSSPLLCAVCGALCVGIGAGLCVRAGGATTGDDALAMSISHRMRVRISTVYLVSDLSVLLLSLSYIPPQRIVWSLITVVLSGQIIGLVAKAGKKTK